MVVLAAGIGMIFLAWRINWELKHPAATFARKVHAGDADARIATIHQLENVGKEDAEVAIPALIDGLGDPDVGVRSAAAMGLVSVLQAAGSAGATREAVYDAVRALIGALKDSQAAVRADAAQALWMAVLTLTGSVEVIDRAQVVGVLIDAAGDPDVGVRVGDPRPRGDRPARQRGSAADLDRGDRGPIG